MSESTRRGSKGGREDETARDDGARPTAKVAMEVGLGGLLSAVAELVVSLGGLAERGGGNDDEDAARGRGTSRGVVGLRVRKGPGQAIERFGNIRRDEATGRAVVGDVFEPMVDVFDETDHLLIVAEMPGVGAEGLRLDCREREIAISAHGPGRTYGRHVTLDAAIDPASVEVSSNNGVFEIRCPKMQKKKPASGVGDVP